MPLSRRSLLTKGAAVGAGAMVVSTTGLGSASAAQPAAPPRARAGARPGPLRPDPDKLLALPDGFRYTLVAQSGVTDLERGGKTPERIDGTGAFSARNLVRLVQNHEIGPRFGSDFPVPPTRGTLYDAGIEQGGGCTVVEVTRRGQRVREWVALSGTISNCAGGVTPWGTWLSCEETEDKAGTTYGTQTLRQDHGFVFEAAPDEVRRQDPRPIKAFGRFPHEAVIVQPGASHVYLTEDASGPNGLLYRWSAPGGLRLRARMLQELGPDVGRLEAMRVQAPDGGWLDDLSRLTAQYVGAELPVRWVHVPDRLATSTSVRKQFDDDEVTRSKKLEGAWGNREGVYFAASFAHEGDVPVGSVFHDGQVWFYDYRRQTLTLKLYFPFTPPLLGGGTAAAAGTGVTYFDGPDNVHVSPFGGLVLAEDGEGLQHLVGWTESRGAFALARNELDGDDSDEGSSYSEMTGPTFSPDGRLLYANIQQPGHTFAISGPFRRYLRD